MTEQHPAHIHPDTGHLQAVTVWDIAGAFVFPGGSWLVRGAIGPGLAMLIAAGIWLWFTFSLFSSIAREMHSTFFALGLNWVPSLIAAGFTGPVLRSHWRRLGYQPDMHAQATSSGVKALALTLCITCAAALEAHSVRNWFNSQVAHASDHNQN